MILNYLLWCIFGISTFFLAGAVAYEAILDGRFLNRVERQHLPNFNYQVSVQIHGSGHVCGGGIIGDRFVLTAAHCIINETRHLRSRHITILAGTNSLLSTGLPAVTVGVETVFFPMEYQPNFELVRGDIAVLKLVDSLILQSHGNIGRAFLSQENTLVQNGRIAGFGWNAYSQVQRIGTTDGRLRYGLVSVLNYNQCKEYFPNQLAHMAFESGMLLCALSDGITAENVCNGDDGGPLMEGRTIIGILSRIPCDCNNRYEPAVYTRVHRYKMMIEHVMEVGHHSYMISLHT